MCGVDCGRWLGTAQQSVTAQRGALAAVKSNRRATVVLTPSVKLPRLTFHRHLLEGVRSASERSRPPKTTRAPLAALVSILHREHLVVAKGLPDGKLASSRTAVFRGSLCATRAPRSGVAGCPPPPKARKPSCAVLTDATRCRAMTAAAGWRPPWRWTTRTSARSTIGAHATMCAELRPRLRPRTRRAVQRYGHSWSPYAIAALG